MAKQYEKVNNLSEAINILNIAFEISVKNKKQEDANRVLALLEGYYQQIGRDQDALKKKREQLLAKLNEKVEESKYIQNSNISIPINKIELSQKLDEVAQLQSQLQKTEEEYNNVKDLLTQTQESVTEKNAYIQDIRLEILEKDSIIKIKNLVIGFSISLIIAVCIILFILFRKNKIEKRQNQRIKEQAIALSIQNSEIEEKSQELITQNEELKITVDTLRKTQKQLAQKEQMAALGKLTAGIAHEINTPLGAIKSSINTVLISSMKNRELLPDLLELLPSDQFRLFLEMINKGIQLMNDYDINKEREIRRHLVMQLQNMEIINCREIADSLIDIGIHDIPREYASLFQNLNIDLIRSAAYHANIQIKASSIISTAVDRISKIISALKYYSYSRNNNEMVKSDIAKGIESVLTLYNNQIKHKITIEKNFDNIPEVLCFPEELNQVWINLINNSIHAIKDSGKIKITTEKADDNIIITFSDNGLGIADNIKDKIFDPFFTTKAVGEGTGLGLDIIKKIIENHHGEISFESSVGIGTTFKIILPINQLNQ